MSPRIGVIADNTLQGHLLSSAVKAQGFELAVNTEPARLDDSWFSSEELELWVVDLSSEDRWQDFLERLLETPVPVLFCDGQAPSQNTEGYPRWERRLLTKMLSYVDKPSLAADTLEIVSAKPHVNIPAPREFQLIDIGEAPARVCVLGASLGGPEAVKLFLDCLPASLPVAFVLAQHIDAGFLNTLSQVLGRDNDFDCRIGFDGETLRYGRVLIAPIDYEITFTKQGRVFSTGKDWDGPYAPSIDQTIANATHCFGAAANAILFSGMGNDGAIAAPQLAHKGGQVWVQSSASCIMPSQPDATFATGCTSFSGTPEQLALQLVERVRQDIKNAAV